MQKMGLQAIYPQRQASITAQGHKVHPYLLHSQAITRPNQVWSANSTHFPMPRGSVYLVSTIDWDGRYVLAWQLSDTLDGPLCPHALDLALAQRKSDISNTDQGAQFTTVAFTSRFGAAGIRISMAAVAGAPDNVFVERLWRSAKYEHLYLYEHASVPEREKGLEQPFTFCSHERPLQSLSYRTPTQARYTSESYPKWL
jgi:putative transposase